MGLKYKNSSGEWVKIPILSEIDDNSAPNSARTWSSQKIKEEIPTQTSQLTNDSNFVTTSDLSKIKSYTFEDLGITETSVTNYTQLTSFINKIKTALTAENNYHITVFEADGVSINYKQTDSDTDKISQIIIKSSSTSYEKTSNEFNAELVGTINIMAGVNESGQIDGLHITNESSIPLLQVAIDVANGNKIVGISYSVSDLICSDESSSISMTPVGIEFDSTANTYNNSVKFEIPWKTL